MEGWLITMQGAILTFQCEQVLASRSQNKRQKAKNKNKKVTFSLGEPLEEPTNLRDRYRPFHWLMLSYVAAGVI